MIAARYPDRMVHVVGDAGYVGERLRDVDSRITWTSRLKVTSVLHELPPLRTGRWADHAPAVPGWGTPADVATLARTTNTWRTTRSAPVRPHRHRADHRTGLSVVWLVSQPATHTGHSGS